MSDAKRLLAAFEGSRAAYGTTVVGRVGRNGKTESNSRVVHGQLDEEKIQAHIDGELGVGSIPINSENVCKFGALDIDTYDLDLQALNRKVQAMKMPLILCRSKSGGAHLFLFLKDWEPAALIREYLTEMSIALGYSGCEIFPKQDKILAERGDVGNFINMPYYGGDITTRYAMDKDGEAVDFDKFFKMVNAKRVSAAELNEMKFGGQRKYFTDGPYCLEVMASQGKIQDNRNITMFAVGVYCRLKWADDWKKHHEEFNRILCEPALEATEIVNIQRSLEKKPTYFYQCDVCPLKDFCDKNVCKTRPFGVGNQAPDMPNVGGLTILMSEPRLYFMDVDGQRMQLTTEQLQNQNLWQRQCMEQLSMMPPNLKAQKWQQMVNELMTKSVKLEVPEEMTIKGQFKELLKIYCTSRIKAMAPEEMDMGKPWTEDGQTRFTIAGVMQFLKNRGFSEYTRAEVQERLKELNGGQECHGHHAIRKPDGKRSTLRVWWVPAFEDDDVYLNTEEKENDIPF
jgi:hypothetical protein